jgi:uncharacterized iron-regulated membrane protein
MKQRNMMIAIHGWVGLIAGLLIVIMGLTGSAIVFHPEIDRSLNPHLMQVQPQGERVAIATFLESIQSAVPGSRLELMQIPQTPDETYKLMLKSKDNVWHEVFIHPYTGAVLGTRQREHTFIGFLYAIHHDLLAGKIGLYLVTLSGIVLMLQAITGLILWTGWRKLASGLRIRWGSPLRLLSFDLHNVSGLFFNLFLLLIGATGVVIAIAHIVLTPAITELPPPFQPTIALGELLNKANTAMPDGVTTALSFPDAQTLVVTKKLPQDHPRFYFSSVRLNSRTGEVLAANKVAKVEPVWKFLITTTDLHFGVFGGLPTRILYVFVGFIPLILFVTGLLMRRRKRTSTNQTQELYPVERLS